MILGLKTCFILPQRSLVFIQSEVLLHFLKKWAIEKTTFTVWSSLIISQNAHLRDAVLAAGAGIAGNTQVRHLVGH